MNVLTNDNILLHEGLLRLEAYHCFTQLTYMKRKNDEEFRLLKGNIE